jgi:hypothetical protein
MSKPLITVLAVTSRRFDEHHYAIARTLAALPIEATSKLIRLPATTTKEDWNRWMLAELVNAFDTPFVLTVHDDGYGINKQHWSAEFLSFDYIGAPWSPKYAPHRVGNGGFSLRSKRWCETAASIEYTEPLQHEDWLCCSTMHREFKDCVIAPPHVAIRFSIEGYPEDYPGWSIKDSFGFHGEYRHNEARGLVSH